MNTGDRIKFYRKEKKLTQTELSDKSGISRNALSNYELNKRKPTIEILEKIANALEINVIFLIEDTLKNDIMDNLKNESSSDSIISLLEERFSKLGNYDRKFATRIYEKFLEVFKPIATQFNLDDMNSIKFELDKEFVNTLAKDRFKFYLENNLLTFEKDPDNPDTILVYFKDGDNNTLNDSK